MITAKLYKYSGLNNVINKPLAEFETVDGLFFKPFNRLNATLQIRVANPDLFDYNYIEISRVGFFFVSSKEIVNNSVLSLTLKLDVLETNKAAILAAVGTVVSRENSDKYISNRENVTDIRPQFVKRKFSNEEPFDKNGSMIMVTLKGRS